MTQEIGGFAALELHPNIVAAVVATGYEEPSAIQQQSIPIILAGHDMIGQAQTGTCLLYTSPSPRDQRGSRMPSSA